MVETIVYEIWAAGRFDKIIHHGKLSFEKVLTAVNLACINLPVVNIHLESDRDAGRAPLSAQHIGLEEAFSSFASSTIR